MLLDDFSVIEYKDEDISQEDLRTVLHMFSDIVQEIIRPKAKKKTFLQKHFSKKDKDEREERGDESNAREAIEHDLYQQHEHLQDEELRGVEEKVGQRHIINQHPEPQSVTTSEQKPTGNETITQVTQDPIVTTNTTDAPNATQDQGFGEENTPPTEKASSGETNKALWAEEDDAIVYHETPQPETETTDSKPAEIHEPIADDESEKDIETTIAGETSWIADAPVYAENTQATKEEDDFPFQSPSDTTEREEDNKPSEEPAEDKETSTAPLAQEEKPSDSFHTHEEHNKTEAVHEEKNTPLPEFTLAKGPAVESVEEDLQDVMSNLDAGLPTTEEHKTATDLKDLAEQLKAVIEKEHLEEAYEETTALAVEADDLDTLIETAERLIIEKNFIEARSVYQEILVQYNELNEEKKHVYFDKVQLLYNLLAHH